MSISSKHFLNNRDGILKTLNLQWLPKDHEPTDQDHTLSVLEWSSSAEKPTFLW